MSKGRFVIYVRRGPDDPGKPRANDARHSTWEAAQREIDRADPPKGCEYFIREEREPPKDLFGVKKKPRPFGR